MAKVEKKEDKKVSKTIRTLGGMAGGAVEACTLQPLDTGWFGHS